MASNFDLIISADYPNRTAEFRLLDDAGVQLAYRQTDFKSISVGNQRALFDLRNYLEKYVDAGEEPFEIEKAGVCIAEEVLGEEIFRLLWTPQVQRTLLIQLPGAAETENHLAAGLARVPWEIARPGIGKETLADRNLVVRVEVDSTGKGTGSGSDRVASGAPSPDYPAPPLKRDECQLGPPR